MLVGKTLMNRILKADTDRRFAVRP
jgi:hypothetical protein